MQVVASAANSDTSNSAAIAIGRTPLALSLLTVISLFVGIIVGIDRISRTTKARCTIEWINNVVDRESDSELRQQILEELKSSQESMLVASLYVPWRKFMWFPLWAIGGGIVAVYCEFHREILHDNWPFRVLYFFFCLCLSWQTVGWRAERAWLSRQYKADQFTNLQTLRHSTDALRALIAVLYSLCSALSCVILYLSIKGSFTPLVSYMIAVIALCIPLFVYIAQRLEKKFFSRWPEYFARKYADRWGVDTKQAVRDDVPGRPI